MSKYPFILQARASSKRLPGKMLLPFCAGKTIPEIIINRLQNVGISQEKIILATSNNEKDNELAEYFKTKGITIFRGDENDVLKRFIDAATFSNSDFFFRVCADNPFVNTFFIKNILQTKNLNEFDYASYYLKNDIPAIRTHFGLFCEFVSLKVLKKIACLNLSPYYHEHVTPYIYENPNIFNIKTFKIPDILNKNQWLRLTIDTYEDFEIVSNLYKEIIDFDNIELIVKTAIKKGLRNKMEKIIKNNTK